MGNDLKIFSCLLRPPDPNFFLKPELGRVSFREEKRKKKKKGYFGAMQPGRGKLLRKTFCLSEEALCT